MKDNWYCASTGQHKMNYIMFLQLPPLNLNPPTKKSEFIILLLIYKSCAFGFIFKFLQSLRKTVQRLSASQSLIITVCSQEIITEVECTSSVAFASFIFIITTSENQGWCPLEFMTQNYMSYLKSVTAIVRESIIRWLSFSFPLKLCSSHVL